MIEHADYLLLVRRTAGIRTCNISEAWSRVPLEIGVLVCAELNVQLRIRMVKDVPPQLVSFLVLLVDV